MRRLCWVLLAVTGCVPLSYTFTPESRAIIPKPDNCKVDVLTTNPDVSYDLVGTLDYYDGPPPSSTEKFGSAVRTQVCEAGGDAVIAIADEKGKYTKGNIIKRSSLPMAQPLKQVNTAPTQATDTEVPTK